MSYKSIKVEESVYERLSKLGSLNSTYSAVVSEALDAYSKVSKKCSNSIKAASN